VRLSIIFVTALAAASVGCAGSFEEAKWIAARQAKETTPTLVDPARDERCRKYDADRRAARARSTALGIIAGTSAGGVGVAEIIDRERDDVSPTVRIVAGLAGLTALAGAMHQDSVADDLGVTWARECSQ